MTMILRPDYDLTTDDRWSLKSASSAYLRSQAWKVLGLDGPDEVNVREVIVGGTKVTTTQTGLPTTRPSGSAVDLVIANGSENTVAINTTAVGWLESVGVGGQLATAGANNLADIIDQTANPTTPTGKVFGFYGVQDQTTSGDLVAIRFKSSQQIRGYFATEHMYESTTGQLVGGYFVDDQTGDPSVIVFGKTKDEDIQVQGIWQSIAQDKKVVIRTLVAEKAGQTITQSPVAKTT